MASLRASGQCFIYKVTENISIDFLTEKSLWNEYFDSDKRMLVGCSWRFWVKQAVCGLCAWPAPPPIYQRLVIVKFGFGCQLAGQQHYSSLPLCTRAPERRHHHSAQTLFLPTFPSYPKPIPSPQPVVLGWCTMLKDPRQNSRKAYYSPPKKSLEYTRKTSVRSSMSPYWQTPKGALYWKRILYPNVFFSAHMSSL